MSVGLALSRRSVRRKLAKLAGQLAPAQLETAGRKQVSLDAVVAQLCGLGEELRSAATAGDDLRTVAAAAGDDLARLRRALDALPQGVVVCGGDNQVRFRNTRATSLLDHQADVLAARAVDDALAKSAGANAEDVSTAERTVELYGPPKRTLTVRTAPLVDAARPLGVIAVIDDVTELRRLEAVRRDFVANVSHELKTPVGALGLLAETLADEEDPVVARYLADRIQTEAFRLGRVINDLLDLSRIEAEESSPKELSAIAQVMTEAADGVRSIAQAAEVGLVLSTPHDGVLVLADRRQLLAALHNLLDNAIKYSESGTSVTLSASSGGEWVDLAVADQGIGIPAQDLDRVFERFYRVDHGRGRETGGTGLGLAIVRHVAHNHGGRVGVESREGEGSRFTLRLPLAQPGTPPADHRRAPDARTPDARAPRAPLPAGRS